ncbi:MAG: PA2169 family four-helix-bundle protein [Myxococcota bacterium]|nr:PA2169 family four-helix-bundle protein [Myxococcota bacterium]
MIGPAKSVGQLNSFLRGEISAVETYRQAIEKVKDTRALTELKDCVQSHERRAELLKDQIQKLGGKPETSSGLWGSFAKLVEGGATAFGDKAAIAALESGEDHGLADYKADLKDLDPESQKLVQQQLLPDQEITHRTLSNLKKSLSN